MAQGAPIKLLHLADLHLDRPFVGQPLEEARSRRRELRDALDRCLALAQERGVDAVTIGGDLWEDEHVTPDTLHWVADRLGALHLPVVLVAGNHDPLRPGGPHRRVRWPENVHLLPADAGLQRFDLGPPGQVVAGPSVGVAKETGEGDGDGLRGGPGGGLTVWGMSWGPTPLNARALEDLAVPADGRAHLLLLHGTAGPAAFQPGAHCPFTAPTVRACGFALCLAGHIHAGGVRDEVIVYPGSPEPLAWDETGRHTAAIVELAPGVPPRVELVDINRRRYAETDVNCHRAASSAELERALRDAVAQVLAGGDGGQPAASSGTEGAHGGLCLRAVLRGRIAPDCHVDLESLRATAMRDAAGALAMLDLCDQTQPAFDLAALAAQPTALGAFVCELRERIESCDPLDPGEAWERGRLERALEFGLRAMHGDELAHAS